MRLNSYASEASHQNYCATAKCGQKFTFVVILNCLLMSSQEKLDCRTVVIQGEIYKWIVPKNVQFSTTQVWFFGSPYGKKYRNVDFISGEWKIAKEKFQKYDSIA